MHPPLDSQALRRLLLAWYDTEHRILPWRSDSGTAPDPYAIWVSEVMLQQTRVDTVTDYYRRWMERFPDVSALSSASLDDVLAVWQGLGYYSRARNLHRAARIVAERHGGRVPDAPSEFLALPGVGRYTMGAVMSIAFGHQTPVVDGNVRRVAARLMDEPTPTDARLWSFAESLASGERPGDINQAVMELGAMVCTPHTPRCSECPIRVHCHAASHGTQTMRPAPRKRGPLPLESVATAVMMDAGRLLLARRPRDARMGGLWEMPGMEMKPGESAMAAAERAARVLAGTDVTAVEEICTVQHVLTHVRLHYTAILCSVDRDGTSSPASDDIAWVSPDQTRAYALPTAQKKILSALEAHLTNEPLAAP